MSFHRRGNPNVEIGMGGGNRRYELGQIPFQMEPKGQKVRDNNDLANARFRQAGNGAGEIGLAEFEEGGHYVAKRTQLGQFRGDLPHAFISAFDAGTVSEDDEGRGPGRFLSHFCGTNPISELRPGLSCDRPVVCETKPIAERASDLSLTRKRKGLLVSGWFDWEWGWMLA